MFGTPAARSPRIARSTISGGWIRLMAACTFGSNSCTPKLARLKPQRPDLLDHRIGERARIALDRDLGIGLQLESVREGAP